MIYNIEKNKVPTILDCVKCQKFDKEKKMCEGLNKICFEYDPKTKTCIDGITKMPLIINKGE